MIQPIVVGTDGSCRADLAVEWAADEAALRRRPLHIVYAAQRWENDVPLHATPGMCGALTETGEHVLAEATTRAVKAHPGLPVTTELVFDTAANALRSFGRRADELVMGHRGSGGCDGMLLGSTALRVAGHTPVPVIVVRGEAGERRGEILAGVGPYHDPADVLAYAFETAALRGAWVRAVQVWDAPSSLPAVSACEAAAMAQERLTDAIGPWRAKFPDVGVVEQTPRGHPVGELAGRSHRASLLVVGSPGLDGQRLGAVGHGVIHHADCPVAVVRSPE